VCNDIATNEESIGRGGEQNGWLSRRRPLKGAREIPHALVIIRKPFACRIRPHTHTGGNPPQVQLPGKPASHGCVRLLQCDAKWLFSWGDEWLLDAAGTRVLASGTPVFIVGSYDFVAPPPWHSPAWLTETVSLPSLTSER
jgi:hypothetical protein